jgi:hypothetical protein
VSKVLIALIVTLKAYRRRSDRLRLFLRLGRCLLWLVRWLRWALFKDNLSFPGNVRVGDLLSKLLQIEFDIGDSLFQGRSSGICSFLSGLAYYREVDSLLRASVPSRPHSIDSLQISVRPTLV